MLAWVIAGVVSVPVLVVAASVFVPAGDVWHHLAATVLARYVTNTAWLVVGVTVTTLLTGVATAWLVTMCVFPGRRVFEWALLLPLAMPAYAIAYAYAGMLDYAGPVQSVLREAFGWSRADYWFPYIRSVGGAFLLLGLVLYPYVYLLSRAAFLEQSVCVLEVGRTLGGGPWRTFWRVALPLARPAIVTGVALALMETLGEFGAVQYFAVDTFTTGIFRTWYGLGDAAAAAQLAAPSCSASCFWCWRSSVPRAAAPCTITPRRATGLCRAIRCGEGAQRWWWPCVRLPSSSGSWCRPGNCWHGRWRPRPACWTRASLAWP